MSTDTEGKGEKDLRNKERKDRNLMIVVKRKLDNLNLEGIFHAKVDELNNLKIIFLKINFENEF